MSTENTATRIGRQKMAAALANEQALDLHEIVLSSNTALPSGLEEAVTNIVYRGLISEQGVVDGAPNQAYFRMIVPENGVEENVDYGPWSAQQFGLLDADGDLIIVGRLAAMVNKPDPDVEPRGFAITVNHIFSDINAINLTYAATQNLPFASIQDHITGTSQTKIAHPAGVAAVIIEAIENLPEDKFLVLADTAETLAGVSEEMATHPAGVRAAIDEQRRTSPNFYFGLM